MAKYRFTGFYPASYQPDLHEPARWIVPGEEIEWETTPDSNWDLVDPEPEQPQAWQFPSASTFPSAHEDEGEK